MTPDQMRRVHFWLTVGWLAIAPPAVIWWRNSVPFLVAVSVYANVAGHWAAHQAALAECRIEQEGS